MNIGPYATFKMTKINTNKAVKSYIHANSLKPYNDPEFRTVMNQNDTSRIQTDDIPIPVSNNHLIKINFTKLREPPDQDKFYEIKRNKSETLVK